jgi:hypothetical protein
MKRANELVNTHDSTAVIKVCKIFIFIEVTILLVYQSKFYFSFCGKGV